MKATPTHTRLKLFASAIAFIVMCFRANSQDITITIEPAVHVTWPSGTNKAYQVETSPDISGDWLPAGGLVEGNGGRVGAFYDATAMRAFFRVRETAASGITWLEGVWQGETYQASSNSIAFTTQIAITNNNRGFSAIYSAQGVTCAAHLNLLSYSESEARFYAGIHSGPCANGIIVLSRVNNTNLLYNWYHPDGPTLASSFAALTKR